MQNFKKWLSICHSVCWTASTCQRMFLFMNKLN